MKILVTGAHFTPAVAVIEELKKYKDVEVVYVGRKTTLEGDNTRSPESRILPTLGVEFISIVSGRLQRTFTIYTIPSLLKIPIGFILAFFIILKEKPDVVLSFGGYVAVPVVVSAWLFSIPILIHEQSLIAGLANKISSFFADKIAISFNQRPKFRSRLTVLTGNPLRHVIFESGTDRQFRIFDVSKKEKLPVILISCGNQGSHIINLAIEKSLATLTKIACIIHITGDNKYDDFGRLGKLGPLRSRSHARGGRSEARESGKFGERYLVRKWIGKEYGSILSKVDLVISRAGVNTLTELAYIGKPTLVIPIPFQEEQSRNARYFERFGLARILPQQKLTAKSLLENIKSMLGDLNSLKNKAKKSKNIIIPDAAKRIALETVLLAGRI